ncbi:MAG: thymidine kinase [Chloroflexaceae bacterium]|nr:thymidine kinase [Chloroflexaceae bacterium]
MSQQTANGRIEIICGCMFSGKTEELIRRIRRVKIARQPFRLFTPSRDTRYGLNQVTSHSGSRLEAQTVRSISEVLNACHDVKVVAMDEIHFLDDPPERIVAACQQMADQGIRVLIATLDQDFRGEPFAAIALLMAVAERVDKLSAICVCCGAEATRSQRLINGHPAPADAPTLMLGGREMYEARCRACHIVPRS